MIPLRDINPRRHFPFVTLGIIFLNILVFIYELQLPSTRALDVLVSTWGLVPYRLMQLDPSAILSVFTSMFLHSGFMHLAGNMLYLWIFGDNIEAALGPLRFLIFYLLCGVGAALGQVLTDTSSLIPMVGASGAISGVLGAYLVLYPHAEVETLLLFGYFMRLVRIPAMIVLGLWVLTQLLSGVLALGTQATGGVAWFAHIGGFFAGVALVGLFRRKRWWE